MQAAGETQGFAASCPWGLQPQGHAVSITARTSTSVKLSSNEFYSHTVLMLPERRQIQTLKSQQKPKAQQNSPRFLFCYTTFSFNNEPSEFSRPQCFAGVSKGLEYQQN